jgi:hypothetical protein
MERSSLGVFPGEIDMIKSLLAATMAVTLMTGGAYAQSSSSTTTTTQSTTTPIVAAPLVSVETSSQKITSVNGVVTDVTGQSSSGTMVSPLGDTTATRKTTETTTITR